MCSADDGPGKQTEYGRAGLRSICTSAAILINPRTLARRAERCSDARRSDTSIEAFQRNCRLAAAALDQLGRFFFLWTANIMSWGTRRSCMRSSGTGWSAGAGRVRGAEATHLPATDKCQS